MTAFSPGKPTHRLRVKEGKNTATVGVAWVCDDGSFTIRLNPCVVLDWKDNVLLKLFPIEEGDTYG